MNANALFKIGYGLYLLSAHDSSGNNACITNSVMQIANEPDRIAISVLKANKTHDMIVDTKSFTVSILSVSAPFSIFQRFGMNSGRDMDKFAGFADAIPSESGNMRLKSHSNAYFSATVSDMIDVGTHTLFIATLTEAELISDEETCTYSYYQKNIKPKPKASGKWVCKICGYVHNDPELPDDFVCPWCQHGREAFEFQS